MSEQFTLQQLKMLAVHVGVPVGKKSKEELFVTLAEALKHQDESAARYCRCLMHVAAKQPEWCLREKAWRETRAGRRCYNPYAVCTQSTGRAGRIECSATFDWSQVPDDELLSYALLFHDQVLSANRWKALPLDRKVLEQGMDKWVRTRK